MRFRISFSAPALLGTVSAIADAVFTSGADIRRCYLGEIIPVIDPHEHYPRSGVFTIKTAETPNDPDQFRHDLKSDIERRLHALHGDCHSRDDSCDIIVNILRITPGEKLHFSIYMETIASEDGATYSAPILRECLQCLYEVNRDSISFDPHLPADICIESLNVDGLICIPVYSPEYLGNRLVFDIRCAMELPAGILDEDSARQETLKRRMSEAIVAYLHDRVGRIRGNRDFSVRATHPAVGSPNGKCKYIIGDPYVNQSAGLRISYRGQSIPGTALQVVRLFEQQGLEVRRAFIGEQDVTATARSRAIFKVYDKNIPNVSDMQIQVKKIISAHYRKAGHPIQPGDLEIEVQPIHEQEDAIPTNQVRLSCQIESRSTRLFMRDLFHVLESGNNVGGFRFSIIHMLHMERFAPPRNGEYKLTDIVLDYIDDKHGNNDVREAKHLEVQSWIGAQLTRLESVRWVSLKQIHPPLAGLVFVRELHD